MKHLISTKTTHVIDVIGNVIGRDQPIMLMEKAFDLVSQLDKSNFSDSKVVFFDPFSKAGEILLACAFYSCLFKANHEKRFLNLDLIKQELYESHRYFALSPDERHHRLSLRTFLGNYNSHDEKHSHIIRDGHYLSEVDGRLDKNKFQKEFLDMLKYIKSSSSTNKIIAVGNPPYQESDGGFGKSARSIYNFFVQALVDAKEIDEFVMVIPARWFGGGKGLDQFRAQMMDSRKIKQLRYFKNSSEIFPTVDINGGVCFIHYVKNYTGLTSFSDGEFQENLYLNEFDIITDDPLGYALVRKIQKIWSHKYIGQVAWSRNSFGLSTNYFSTHKEALANNENSVPCLTRNRKIKYVEKNQIIKNLDKIDCWKVSVPAVAGGSKGNRRATIPINQIFIIPTGTIATETYSIVDAFKTKEEAENLISYLKTDFARYFLGLRKMTQHIPKDRWNWVPYVDTTKSWNDEELFLLFKLSKEEQLHIQKKVEEWS